MGTACEAEAFHDRSRNSIDTGEQELEFVDITTIYRRGGVDTILSLLRQAFRQKTVTPEQQRRILVGSGQSLFFDAIKPALDVAIS